VIKYSMFIPFN